MSKRPLCFVFFFLAFLTVSTSAQKKAADPSRQDQADVVRVDTNLVQTDVMVFDRQGKFVEGLPANQFEVLVDGKRQPILFFESVVSGSEKENAQLKAVGSGLPVPPPEKLVAASSTTRGRTILFFVDDLHLSPSGIPRVRKTVLQFIENLREGDQVAITSSSGRIGFLQQLTNNKAVLRAAVERITFVPSSKRDSENPSMSEYAALQILDRNDEMGSCLAAGSKGVGSLFCYFVVQTMKANNIPPSGEGIAKAIVQRRAQMLVMQSDAANKLSLVSLGNLMRSISGISGRKLMFFISEGFVPNYRGSDVIDALHRATDGAASAGVVIYSLDARGLATDPSLDASNAGGFDPSGVLRSNTGGELSSTQDPLFTLAADTGGRAFVNSNSLIDGIGKALEETSNYYLLAWRPELNENQQPKSSKIKILITGRPDLKVQLRRGWFGMRSSPTQEKDKAKEKDTAQLPTAVTADEVYDSRVPSTVTGLQASLSLGYKQLAPGNMQLLAVVQVTENAIADDQRENSSDDEAVVLGAVFDSNGKAVGSFKRVLRVQKGKPKAPGENDSYNHLINVSPGLYQVRTFAKERKGQRMAGAMEWVEIPNLKPGQLAMSSIFLGEVSDPQSPSEVSVSASRTLARSSALRFTTYIYNAAHPPQSSPELGVQTTILQGDRTISLSPERKVATENLKNFSIIPYSAGFPLAALPVGRYKLLVKVTDRVGNSTASYQTDFVVY